MIVSWVELENIHGGFLGLINYFIGIETGRLVIGFGLVWLLGLRLLFGSRSNFDEFEVLVLRIIKSILSILY